MNSQLPLTSHPTPHPTPPLVSTCTSPAKPPPLSLKTLLGFSPWSQCPSYPAQPLHLASSATPAHPRVPCSRPRPSSTWQHLALIPLSLIFTPRPSDSSPLRSPLRSSPGDPSQPQPEPSSSQSWLPIHTQLFSLLTARKEDVCVCVCLSVCLSVCVCVSVFCELSPKAVGDPKL